MSVNDEGYKIALEEGREGVKEVGVGVGSAIMSADGKLLGRGRNMRYAIPSLQKLKADNIAGFRMEVISYTYVLKTLHLIIMD